MSKQIFYEGQEVGCLMLGKGVVSSLEDSLVFVTIKNRMWKFSENGAYYQDARPTLYPIDQYREIIANLPAPQPEAWKPKPGEWCWFWDDSTRIGVLDQFQYADSGRYYTSKVDWQNCAPFTGELPEHLKEVQP